MSASSVYTLLRSQGVALRGQRIDMLTAERVVSMYGEVRSIRQVSESLLSCISLNLRDYGKL